ncbi:hypothetical protein GCM10027168_33340 [Streptomyces capparidis]
MGSRNSDDVVLRLAGARPEHLDPDGAPDPATRAAELAAAMAAPRERAAARERFGRAVPARARRMGLVGAAAAAALVVAVTASEPRFGQDGRPSARSVLLAAAEAAERAPEGEAAGKFWKRQDDRLNLHPVASQRDPYVIAHRSGSVTYIPWGGDHYRTPQESVYREYAPYTQADRAAWRRAGSPDRVRIWARQGTEELSLSDPSYRLSGVDVVYVGWLDGRGTILEALRKLPTDPDALRADLLKSRDRGTAGDRAAEEEWLFNVASGIILTFPASPELRSAAFRMVADLDGLKVIDDVRDARGRAGTAVALTRHTQYAGVIEERLVLDSETAKGLAKEYAVVKPGGETRGLDPGTVFSSHAVTAAEWVDSAPEDD